MSTDDRPLLTLGHSNHPSAHFLALLARHGVEVVADVRSRPYSRFVPQYRKQTLAGILADAGIGYLFLGEGLGGKPPRDFVRVQGFRCRLRHRASRDRVPPHCPRSGRRMQFDGWLRVLCCGTR